MESIEPFNYKDVTEFQIPYLAGYFADKYGVGSEESIERANQRIKESTEASLMDTVQDYTTVTSENSSISIRNGNKYSFAMKGQTGKFIGDLPIDKREYWK